MNKLYQSFGSNQRQGFTLMEIMVVIIVIAVLASVAGPMIGSITDQGKASATKAQMQNLKTAFVNFANDLGRYPHKGVALNSASFNDCWDYNMPARNGGTCPFTDQFLGGAQWSNLGMVSATYNKRWKGPYIDGNPENFFIDSWGGTTDVFHMQKGLWIHSAGPDGTFSAHSAIPSILGPTYGQAEGEEDILVSIAKVKF